MFEKHEMRIIELDKDDVFARGAVFIPSVEQKTSIPDSSADM